MNSRSVAIVVCSLALVGLWLQTANAVDRDISFAVPLLSTSENGEIGRCHEARFAFERRAELNRYLSVAIVEDTPGGAGDSLRASMWLAAMVAALEHMDHFAGVKISLEISGSVDGPSAGTAICLAILSAVDGRSFPTDCAVTGAIMPDGTIGDVGGLPAKLTAAAQAGKKRVIVPAYVRFVRDEKSGQDVDLKRLAASLGLELIAATNVRQAYYLLQRESPLDTARIDRDLLEVPEVVEDVLKQHYATNVSDGTKLWSALPQNEREDIASNNMRQFLVQPRQAAEQAYRAGKLLYATSVSREWLGSLQAYGAARSNLQEAINRFSNSKGRLKFINDSSLALLKTAPAQQELFQDHIRRIFPIAAQLWPDFNEASSMRGLCELLQQAIDTEPPGADGSNQAEIDQFNETQLETGFIQSFIAHAMVVNSQRWPTQAQELAKGIVQRRITGDLAATERLFHSAYSAAHDTFTHDVIRQVASGLSLTDREAYQVMCNLDSHLLTYTCTHRWHDELHDQLPVLGGDHSSGAATVSAAHLHANGLAAVNALLTRWNRLDVEIVNQQLSYRRTDLLNYLMSEARENALHAIAQVKAKGIPCLMPIQYLEMADMTRDDPEHDKVGVLASYWNASLQAKVLLMLFGNEVKVPTDSNLQRPVLFDQKATKSVPALSGTSSHKWTESYRSSGSSLLGRDEKKEIRFVPVRYPSWTASRSTMTAPSSSPRAKWSFKEWGLLALFGGLGNYLMGLFSRKKSAPADQTGTKPASP